ncbi:DHA2 family efflux MFS transporter permease subunit [Planomonospora parontospora]|uniref:DHA2 family efflux MFS transporter permease subunit n=1 Tax=Planomonospora parontospora TaxID=58119 RepID=UPI00167162BF|nr:DHA2 family efflux MFS transporter permease subunit [Planomonospora parontospora]GGL40621.1 MFS transporter [Planomonospora parontospora subsp. antibiotica]GII18242.1 MFS transporter [Planomonospora parontospora subsp. antibiotica]
MTLSDNSLPAYPKARQRWTLILASFASFMVGLDVLVVTTALPTLHEELGAGVSGLGWTVSAYELGFAAFILTGAALGDRFGRRALFVTGVGLFTLSSALCAMSGTIETLIAARALQGVGGGIAIALALAVIADATPPQERGAAFGVWGAISGVAVAAGPLVGGLIIQGFAWQWIFWLNVPVGVVLIVMSLMKIAETRGETRAVDLLGLVLSTLGVFGIAQALIRGGEVGWTSPAVLGGFVGGAVALVLFVIWETRTSSPMMPLSMFRNRSFTGGCLTSFVLAAALYGNGFVFAQYLQLAEGNDPLGVGIRLLPWVGLAIFISPIAGKMADSMGERPLVIVGLLLHGIGFLAIALMASAGTGYGPMIFPLLLAGIGVSIAFPTVASAVMRSVSPMEVGIAAGVSNTIRQVGAVFGVAAAAAVFTAAGGYGASERFVAGFTPATIVLAVITFAGVAAALIIRRPDYEASAASMPPEAQPGPATS